MRIHDRTHLRKKRIGGRLGCRRVREIGRFGRKRCRVCSWRGLEGRFAANASAGRGGVQEGVRLLASFFRINRPGISIFSAKTLYL